MLKDLQMKKKLSFISRLIATTTFFTEDQDIYYCHIYIQWDITKGCNWLTTDMKGAHSLILYHSY